MKNPYLLEMKAELKKLSEEVRANRQGSRQMESRLHRNTRAPADNWSQCHKLMAAAGNASYLFRHKHIAYCMIRGRTIDQIEKNAPWLQASQEELQKFPYNYNKPDMERVSQIISEYTHKVTGGLSGKETVRVSEEGSQSVAASSAGGACGSGVCAPSPKPVEKWYSRILAVFG